MALRQGFARLAWVTLLVTMMLFAAAPAEAHGGHDHDRAFHTAETQALSVPASEQDIASPAAIKPAQQTVSAIPVADLGAATCNGSCTGGCCGSGLACCSAVILAPTPHFPDIVRTGARLAANRIYSHGIDPDALRRPPRNLD